MRIQKSEREKRAGTEPPNPSQKGEERKIGSPSSRFAYFAFCSSRSCEMPSRGWGTIGDGIVPAIRDRSGSEW